MAPLPDNSSSRVWLRYATGGGVTSQEHELQFRFSTTEGGNAATALALLGTLIDALGEGSFFDGWQAISARYSLVGQNFSLPIALPAVLTAFTGSGQATASLVDQARELRFVGRSDTTGRRGSMSFYGVAAANFVTADFRLPRLELNIVDTFLDFVEEADSLAYFVAIDQSRLTYRDYGNWQFNSYWERELRV